MLGTPIDVANVYVLTIPSNTMAMLHRAPCLHQEVFIELAENCKNHLWRLVAVDIEGEQLPGVIVTCKSAFGETFYAGSSAGGSALTDDSEFPQVMEPVEDNKSLVSGFDQKSIRCRQKHKDTVQLLMNLGNSVAHFTVEDGTTVDLIGVQLSIMLHVPETRNAMG
ncbi:hypothetical protein Bca101_018505 [Brassica carinata]